MPTKPTKKLTIEQEEIKQEDTIEQQEDIQEDIQEVHNIDNSSTTKRISLAAATGLGIDSDLVKYYADQF